MKATIKTRDADGNRMIINISLTDYFSITGEIYERGKPMTDKNMITGGCIHDDILKVHPDLKMFVDLHLSSSDGVPMYAFENGFFFYSDKHPNADTWFKIFCEHLRITKYEGDLLVAEMDKIGKKDMQKLFFAAYVNQCLPRWKREAQTATELLEKISSGNIAITK